MAYEILCVSTLHAIQTSFNIQSFVLWNGMQWNMLWCSLYKIAMLCCYYHPSSTYKHLCLWVYLRLSLFLSLSLYCYDITWSVQGGSFTALSSLVCLFLLIIFICFLPASFFIYSLKRLHMACRERTHQLYCDHAWNM